MKVRCWQINDNWRNHSWENWFSVSLAAFAEEAPSIDPNEYDYIQIIPMSHYHRYWNGNSGAQAFRHKESGWTFPDHCRQRGGCPEMWTRTRRWQLNISCDSPIWGYVVDW